MLLAVNFSMCSVSGCTFPTAPSGGRVRRVEYDVSEDVDYICRRGFTTVGDPQVCSQNGTFVGKVPKCKGDLCNFE